VTPWEDLLERGSSSGDQREVFYGECHHFVDEIEKSSAFGGARPRRTLQQSTRKNVARIDEFLRNSLEKSRRKSREGTTGEKKGNSANAPGVRGSSEPGAHYT